MHPVDESAGDDMWKAFVAADAAVVAPVELEDRLFDALQTTEHCARPHSYRSMIGSVGLAAAVLLMTISSWPRSHVDRADRLAR